MVTQKTKVVHLYPDGTYGTSRGSRDAEWPNMLMTTHGRTKMAYSLVQNPVFPESKPVRMDFFQCEPCKMGKPADCLGCLLGADPPDPPLNEQRRMMMVEANYPFPVSCAEPFTDSERHSLGESIAEEMLQSAKNKASNEANGYSSKRLGFMVLVGLTVFISVIFGFSAWSSMHF